MFKYGLFSPISKWRPISDVSVSSSILIMDEYKLKVYNYFNN